jgi:hypothetical protein
LRRELDEVPVPPLVFDEKRQVLIANQASGSVLLVVSARSDIGLHPDDRLYALLLRLAVEWNRAEEIAVICQGHGAHLHSLRRRYEVLDPESSIEKAVFRMVVKM